MHNFAITKKFIFLLIYFLNVSNKMTNQQILYQELAQLNSSLTGLDLGVDVGTNLATIATNSTSTASSSSTLAGAVSSSKINTNISSVNGTSISSGSGINGSGVQRVTIATDDNLVSNISTTNTTLASTVSSSKVNTNVSSLAGTVIATNIGVNGAGVQRITIATDDTTALDIATIANSIKTSNSDLYSSGVDGISNYAVYSDGVTSRTGDPGKYVPIASDICGVQYTNVKKINDTLIASGDGVNGSGVQRVTIATDDGMAVDVSDIKTNSDNLNSCLDLSNYLIATNTKQVNGSNTSVNSGGLNAGTQRICIATDDINSSAINSNTTALYNCIDHVNNYLKVDTNAINGVVTAVNSGVNGNGVQRVTIATDDTLVSDIDTLVTNIYDQSSLAYTTAFTTTAKNCYKTISSVRNDSAATSFGTNNGSWSAQAVDSNGVVFQNIQKVGGTTVSTNTGVVGAGCLRVTIATDDNVSTKLTTISTTLTNIYNILNAVYSAGAATGQLRTNVIP